MSQIASSITDGTRTVRVPAVCPHALWTRSPSPGNERLGLRPVVYGAITCTLYIALNLLLFAPSSCQAQLFLGTANSDIRLETLNEFLLFDPVSKSQVLAIELGFHSDVMPVGVILPVPSGSKLLLGKRTLFESLRAIAKPKHQKQRKLKLSFSSYLWGLVAITAPPSPEDERRSRSLRSSPPGNDLTRQQAVDWALEHGLYIPVETVTSLRELADLGYRFKTLLFDPSTTQSTNLGRDGHRFHSPTLFLRSRAERPQPLTEAFGGKKTFTHKLSILSDQPYSLRTDGQAEFTTTYRNYLSKHQIKNVVNTIPKAMHTFQRAAYFQTFELPPDFWGRIQTRAQRMPQMVKPKDVASYEPLLITIPLEIMGLFVLLGLWAWNREKSPLKAARSQRIQPR